VYSRTFLPMLFNRRWFQAFLVVLGTNGLLVDGCKVYANTSPSHVANPTTIPLSNNSEFEIHSKRFRFTYPPKELRAALMATPARVFYTLFYLKPAFTSI
jgi:hypothetical protein